MARPVYSTLFIEVSAQLAFAEYVVPAGMTLVVRDVAALCLGSADDTAFNVENHNTAGIIAYHGFTDAYEFYHDLFHQVVPSGSTLSAQSSGPTEVSIRVSGYLLTAD